MLRPKDDILHSTAQNSGVNNMEGKQLDIASKEIKSFIYSSNFEALKTYLNNTGHKERRQIVNHVQGDCAPFFLACYKDREDIVKYMLMECNPDIELRGFYQICKENFKEWVTPLWVAVSEEHLSLVKLLVSYGADVNSTTSTNSTAVRCACYCGNLDIVKYLVENGADIHKRNVYGGTCLINATKGSLELCQFLISHGIAVNATTISGYSAMYHAIELGRLDLVELFLTAGASHFVTITSEVHILYLAAIQGNRTIFNYIRDNTAMKISRLVNGYELLGATIIDEYNNISEGIDLWEMAMELRFANPEAPLRKILANETKQAYQFHRECATPEQCRTLVGADKDTIYMHALLTRERILGTRNEQTIYGIRYRGAVYADYKHYRRAIDLWKYAFLLRRHAVPTSDEDLVSDLRMFVDLFKAISEQSSSDESSEKVQSSDIVDIFGMVVELLQEFTDVLKIRPLEENTYRTFRSLLVYTIGLMNLFFVSIDQDVECDNFIDHVKRAVMLNTASEEGEQLLHLALMIDPNDTDNDVPSIGLIRCLITTGAYVNSTDKERNTPLHHCIASWRKQRNSPRRAGQWKELAWSLIENGAHIDARNSGKDVPLEFLLKQDLLCPLKYITLKCMTARVIVDTGMSYRGYLPSLLEAFVELHR
ncbi:protein fem-1 homolog C-like [Argopecten irradians]|uniref:protein fem-1 homolog C-like n=1 Tax=Argopecten irradians TaxID=31199 RepID=UPI0037240A8E